MSRQVRSRGEIVRQRFHYVQQASLAGGVNNLALNPTNISPRCTTEADAFEWYRIVSLKFRLLASTSSACAGFVEGKPDTMPSTQAQVIELLDSVMHVAAAETCWSRWVNVPKVALAGALPWYKTVQGAATDEEELVGFLVVAGTGTNAFNLEYYVEVEFKGPIATANTPAMLALRKKEREERARQREIAQRARLLGFAEKVGAATTPSTPAPSAVGARQ